MADEKLCLPATREQIRELRIIRANKLCAELDRQAAPYVLSGLAKVLIYTIANDVRTVEGKQCGGLYEGVAINNG